MEPKAIQDMIESGLEGSQARVSSPDNTHFEAVVVSSQFEGKRALARHQMVYATLGTLVGNEIHALSIQALTPAELAQKGG